MRNMPWLVAGLLAAWALWQALSPPRPLSWTPDTPWLERAMHRVDAGIRARWTTATQHQAQILGLPSWQIVGYYSAAAVIGGLGGYDLHHQVWMALGVGLVALWQGPPWIIRQMFGKRQRVLARDFPPLVLMLRIYLALGQPLAQALAATRPALSRLGQAEVNRLLAAIQRGDPAALKAWAQRTGLSTYRLLADTLAQGWGQGLTADALVPLDTLIRASREQGTRALTDRLDSLSTIVPVIAAFGVFLVLLDAIVAGQF